MGLFLGVAYLSVWSDLPSWSPTTKPPVSELPASAPPGPALPGKGLLGSRENIQPADVDPGPNLVDSGSAATGDEPAVTVIRGSAAFRVVDGDTFSYGGDTIRIADIDTPETYRARCPEEAALGALATRRLAQLLGAGPFELHSDVRDVDAYGRKLRIVTRGGRSLGDTLVTEGLARPYGNGRRPWCS